MSQSRQSIRKVLFALRDGKCGRCGCSLSLDFKFYGSIFALLHHINPKSKGGTDNYSNLLLTCQYCETLYHSTQPLISVREKIEDGTNISSAWRLA
ncbi:hypothetical protein LCGC14_0357670 [marine sediment metagenome]|uniref:HNH nuclease domain-containing protein n=1 Tax=marine sediment metagenome TaxID=412755 RepID=A0A0F9TRR3_9ZZZZ